MMSSPEGLDGPKQRIYSGEVRYMLLLEGQWTVEIVFDRGDQTSLGGGVFLILTISQSLWCISEILTFSRCHFFCDLHCTPCDTPHHTS